MDEDVVLLCRAGERRCALPLRHVIETMRPLPVEVLDRAHGELPSYVRGLALIRGAATPVIDARALFEDTAPRESHGRFVTLRADDATSGVFALEVDAVVDVRALRTGTLPPLLGPALEERISGVGRFGDGLVYVLRSSRLVPPEVWAILDDEARARSA